jgi:GH15 family glucan-1,4-alpha-glucosidase
LPQALGSRDLDASALQIGIQGFVALDDPRFDATIRAVDDGLSVGGHVDRGRSVDGLAGDEGTFVFCTLWQARALATVGRLDDARQRLQLVLDHANDLGLLAEEIEPQTGEHLGNFPQAFSHVGVIGTACAIDASERGPPPAPTSAAIVDGSRRITRSGWVQRHRSLRSWFGWRAGSLALHPATC